MRSTYAVINLNALKKNFLGIRKKVKNVKLMAVVKADAYGHGVKETVGALNSLEKKPEYFAVAFADEGIELRKLKIPQPVLIFEPPNKEEAEDIIRYNLIPTICSAEQLSILSKAKDKLKEKKKIKLHIKVDTGMNRLGISCSKAFSFIKKVSEDNDFIIDGIYTHFATSDEKDKSFAYIQLKRFNGVIDNLKKEKIEAGLVHAANSGAILDMPEAYFDMVRPGISLYGYYPSLETSESIPLEPVMSLYSEVNSVKEISKGEPVSYGRKFTAKKKIKVAAVPIGYADGFPRNLSNKAKAIIKGKIYSQIGTVTMDRVMFDVGKDNIFPEDKVVLLGKRKNHEINGWDWSKVLHTIPYEITCGISKRIPRVYKN